jgi:hypothetical protein
MGIHKNSRQDVISEYTYSFVNEKGIEETKKEVTTYNALFKKLNANYKKFKIISSNDDYK